MIGKGSLVTNISGYLSAEVWLEKIIYFCGEQVYWSYYHFIYFIHILCIVGLCTILNTSTQFFAFVGVEESSQFFKSLITQLSYIFYASIKPATAEIDI